MTSIPPVHHDTAAHRFEIETDAGPAVLEYREGNGVIDLVHTGVPPAFEGKGYGTALVRAALDYARSAGLRVIPSCPFVRAYLERQPAGREASSQG